MQAIMNVYEKDHQKVQREHLIVNNHRNSSLVELVLVDNCRIVVSARDLRQAIERCSGL